MLTENQPMNEIRRTLLPGLLSLLVVLMLTGSVALAQSATPESAVAPTVEEQSVVADDKGLQIADEPESESVFAGDPYEVEARLTIEEFWNKQKELSRIDYISSEALQLNDTHLGDVLWLALNRNRSIAGAEQQIESANAGVIQARSLHGARLTGNFRYTRVDDVANPMVGKDSQSAYLEITQPLFLSGKDRAVLNQARFGRSTADAGLILARQHVLLDTTLRWLAWQFAAEAERVSEKDLELAKAHHELVSTRYKHKQVSQFEVLRAEVRLAKAGSDLRKQINARELAGLDLLNVLDLPPETPISTQDRMKMLELPVNYSEDASAAMQLREDLRMKRLEVEIARQGLSGARAENQPVVSLFGQKGVADPAAKSRTFDRESYWNAGVVANFTLGDGGMRKGKIKDAHAKLALADNALKQAEEKARIEIKQAYLNIETAKEVIAAQRKALKQAEEALRLAGVRYTNGLFTQVELFDAENAYLATRLQYLQAILSYHQAYASYRLSTGQLGRRLLDRLTARQEK